MIVTTSMIMKHKKKECRGHGGTAANPTTASVGLLIYQLRFYLKNDCKTGWPTVSVRGSRWGSTHIHGTTIASETVHGTGGILLGHFHRVLVSLLWGYIGCHTHVIIFRV